MKTVEIVKKDILDSLKELPPKYYTAFLEGVFRARAELNLSRTGVALELSTDDLRLAEEVGNILLKLGVEDIVIEKHVRTTAFEKVYVSLRLSSADTHMIFEKCGMSLTSYGIPDGLSDIVKKDFEASTAFLKGLFAASGRLSIPERGKKSQGYHLELQMSSESDCREVIELLSATDIAPRASMVKRNIYYSVYVKSKDEISDFVAAMGSNSVVLKLQDIIMERELINRLNREENCNNANLDKIVNAGTEMILHIKKIDEKIGLKSLPSPLYETALARLEHPELSMSELLGFLDNPPTKSGLQHRFKKIKSIAEKL